MDSAAFTQDPTAPRGQPAPQVSPDDELRALFGAIELCRELCTAVADHAKGSPTRAALFTQVVERAHRMLDYTQLQAARAAQQNLVHELPAATLTALRAINDAPEGFIGGEVPLPDDPQTVPQGRPAFKDTTEFLQQTLGITHFEARDRLHAAFALLPLTDIHGNPQAPRYPKLAEQLQNGKARVGPTTAAARKLDKLRHGIQGQSTPDTLGADIEGQIARSVLEDSPQNTKRIFDALGDRLDGTTEEPSAEEIRAKTGIFVTRRTRNFTYMNLCLLNIDAEVFFSHFALSDNPRTNAGNRQAMAEAATVTGKSGPANGCQNSGYLADGTALTTGDGPDWFTMPATATALDPPAAGYDFSAGFKETFNATTPGSDGLTPPQRHIQTLLNLMRAPAAPGAKGTTGLPTARLVVYAYLETLLGLARGSGWSAHGLEIPIGEIRRKLSEFGAIPIVLGGQSEILDVGREMRFAPDYMKQAVLARDGGCIYPGCTVPAEHCEFNHIRGWVDGGETSVDNLDAECTGHHHLTHTGESKIVIHNGLPHVILPRYLDPEQKPRRNNYWQGLRPTLF